MRRTLFIVTTVSLVISLLFSSCNKFDESYDYVEISAVSAVNVIAGNEGVNISLDQNRLNGYYDGAFSYNHILTYRNAYPGTRRVRVSELSTDNTLIDKSVTFLSGKYYSLYVIGQKKMELLELEDNFGNIENGNAKFRFINLSEDASKLSLTLNKVDSLAVKELAYKEYSSFKQIKSEEPYQLRINGIDMPELVGEFKPESKEVYTIYVSGSKLNSENNRKYNFQIVKHR